MNGLGLSDANALLLLFAGSIEAPGLAPEAGVNRGCAPCKPVSCLPCDAGGFAFTNGLAKPIFLGVCFGVGEKSDALIESLPCVPGCCCCCVDEGNLGVR